MDIVIGYQNREHVTAEQLGRTIAGLAGDGTYLLATQNGLAASMQTANQVRIDTGDVIAQGRVLTVETPETLTVESGVTGEKRVDLVVARYKKEQSTSVESAELVVVKGTPVSYGDPSDPQVNEGSILDGDSPVDVPLYRITIDGLAPGTPERVIESTPSITDLRDSVSQARWQTLLTNACHYARSGGMVVVQLYNLTLSKSARRTVGTLPEGFRPTGAATWDGRSAVGLVYGGGSNLAYAYVSPEGEVWCDYASADGDYTGQLVFPA